MGHQRKSELQVRRFVVSFTSLEQVQSLRDLTEHPDENLLT